MPDTDRIKLYVQESEQCGKYKSMNPNLKKTLMNHEYLYKHNENDLLAVVSSDISLLFLSIVQCSKLSWSLRVLHCITKYCEHNFHETQIYECWNIDFIGS